MDGNKIEIKNLSVTLGEKDILKNISFSVESKKPVCIIGEGSSGKTTLLKSILGLIPISNGDVLVNKVSLNKISNQEKESILNYFGVVFQKDALFDSLLVWQNIMFRKINSGLFKKDLVDEAEVLLKKVGMDGSVLNLFPSELSGGMKKRVAIARAVSCNPKFLILDEPTSGLDPIKTNMIFSIIEKLSDEFKVSVLAVTSDIKGAIKYFNTLLLLKNECIEWIGDTKKIEKVSNESLKFLLSKA